MERRKIGIDRFNNNIFKIFNKEWMLLNGGDSRVGKCNPMTISWGFMGTIWFRPTVMVVVRPQRYTREFMEKYDSFTLNLLPEEKKDILSFCGAHSGREFDKVKECGLTPIASEEVGAPGFDEAELIVECKKLYCDQLKGKNFLDKSIVAKCYPDRDFHHMFIGEVMNISGASRFMKI